jgi:CRISPR-associated endonuclease/helicase Cas3
MERKGGLHDTRWLSGALHQLFSPVAVSTVDRVLLGALRQKYSPVRLLALANKHVIIDEVHTFDHYQSALLDELLVWFGETDTRVTLLSATLPQSRLTSHANAYAGRDVGAEATYPGHVLVKASGATMELASTRREYDLELNLIDVDPADVIGEHVRLAKQYHDEDPDQRIAVVVNTVDRAIAIAEELQTCGLPVITLHARMTQGHRKHVSEELLRRAGKEGDKEGLVAVGTQVIEASLDVDFDHMITDLAPTSSLIQRAGRLWRHSIVTIGLWTHLRRRPTARPQLDIVVPTVDGSIPDTARFPYLIVDLKRSRGAITQVGGVVNIPAGVQNLVDLSTPTEADEDFGVETSDVETESREKNKRLGRADRVVIKFDRAHARESVLAPGIQFSTLATITSDLPANESQTRFIEEDTVTVVLIDPSGEHRWAWHGTPLTLMNARGLTTIQAIQSATLSVRRSLFTSLTGVKPSYDRPEWTPSNYILKTAYPVDVADVTYDEMLGLMR